ncbi:hypothetical protein [uncultured Massilia sp.]|uniref:hypothetical protein n=1 Tax=uncultured Massilia sp. TaxID=169973 RepID=UPI00258BAA25|nr:hypothetical protein [uncultured Massilia sp.]
MTFDELKKITRRTVQSAGPRYTPGVKDGAPNLHIQDLERAVAGLAVSSEFTKLLTDAAASLLKALEQGSGSSLGVIDIVARINSASSLLRQLANQPPHRGRAVANRLKKAIVELVESLQAESYRVSKLIWEKRDELTRTKELRDPSNSSVIASIESELSKLQTLENGVREILGECRKCDELLESSTLQLRFLNRALLLGPWGSGKTYFLCDISLALLRAKVPSVVVLAKDISASSDIGANLSQALGVASLDEVLASLDEMGRKANVRSLLMIDGINEGDFGTWRKFVIRLTSRVKAYKFVGLVISCRTPMEKLILSDNTRKKYIHLHHPGFGEVEFDAQRAFFSFYDVPLPEVPLLTEEFSRPLTLKILCKSFAELPKKEQRKGFTGLTSGQKGMTFVLESFVKRRAEQVEKDLGLPSLFCWKLIKGDDAIRDHCLKGLAPYMAEKLEEAVPFDEAVNIVRMRPEISSSAAARALLARLIQEGVIYDYARWTGDGKAYERVVALPYQRFSDHIIARHLLAHHLDKTDESTIRSSLLPGTPVGRIFKIEEDWNTQYASPALAEAVIIEFPETVKKKIAEGKRELYFYLPPNSQDLSVYYRPFLDGFSWRAPTTVDTSTERILAALVDPKYPVAYRATMDVLVMVATKPAHPLSVDRLLAHLTSLNMAERDLSWSEALRHSEPGSAIDRVVHFYADAPLDSLSREIASLAVKLLSSFLTTTDRLLRDKATLGLVRVGERHPASLFAFAEAALKFNDPYVAERVLAAMYGVTMSLRSEGNGEFTAALSGLVSFLVKEMFSPDGKFQTCHVLTRDYALGIIELSSLIVPGAYPEEAASYLKAPFFAIPSPFPESRKISPSTIKKVASAIHMDFGNYTMGRLIKGRANYDDKHPEYKLVRRQIEWRMANLGYSTSRFADVDSDISRSQHYHGRGDTAKVNRYGKKYSWIAYFEMYGLRQAQGLLDRFERPSDMDIDPSFPILEDVPLPSMTAVFNKKRLPKKHMRWMKNGPAPDYSALYRLPEIDGQCGPWRLVSGYVNESDESTFHHVWAHIHTFLVSPNDVLALEREFKKEGFPPHELTHQSEDHQTFAGEIGWSRRVRPKPEHEVYNTVVAYGRHERRTVAEPLKEGWRRLEVPLLLAYFKSGSKESRAKSRVALEKHLKEINKGLSSEDQLTIHEVTDVSEIPSADEFNAGTVMRLRWTTVNGYEVEPLAWTFSPEGHGSELNKLRYQVPAPSFVEANDLRPRRRSVSLFDGAGIRATFYIKNGEEYSDSTELLYVREDLLHQYAKQKGKCLVRLSWGEREVHHSISREFWDDEGHPAGLKIEDTILKSFDVVTE